MIYQGSPVQAFSTLTELHEWLVHHHAEHAGVWVRLRRAGSQVPSVTFTDLLEEGLCFGWSESTRHPWDDDSYLQRFTPRRTRGTTSERNRRLAVALVEQGRMTPAGLAGLNMRSASTNLSDS